MAQTLENSLPNCDKKVFKKGYHLATIINLSAVEIESIVKSAAEKSGARIDWHYFGGRGVVKALGDLEKAKTYLEYELKCVTHANYRFTTGNDSAISWPIK
ncbi:MAG TPA: hypothetical protein VJH92_00765 [Candidatus Nanoarchaeia archaeon]|nr:hypothetical protein [Candidatus Nanoarchaeia archaeon]